MRGKLILVGVLAAALAGCGGSSATSSPSTAAGSSSAPASSTAAGDSGSPGASEAASGGPVASETANTAPTTAICDGVSLRKAPSSSGAKVKTINSGTAVHAVATVNGTAYTAGTCGTSGSTWLKIDKVGGKTAKSLYGVTYVYAAAGFFQ